MSQQRKRRVILGVTGSTAATKSQSIALALQHRGFEVRVAMSYSSQKIVGRHQRVFNIESEADHVSAVCGGAALS